MLPCPIPRLSVRSRTFTATYKMSVASLHSGTTIVSMSVMHLHREPKAHTEVSTQRIEAFSDGIFSIAITLLVLEIKVPEFPEGGNARAAKLLSLWPSYLGFVFSFVMIGIHWANHHYIFTFYERRDH